MNKKLLVLAFGAAGMAAACSAQAHEHDGWFINGGVGTTYYQLTTDGYDNGHSNDFGGQINLGWRDHFLGFEAGYVNLGKSKGYDYYDNYLDLSGEGLTLGLNARFNPVAKWYLEFRGGLLHWSVKGNVSAYDYPYATYMSGTLTGNNWYAGFGTGGDFNRHWSLGARIDVYDIRADFMNSDNHIYTIMTSVNLEYRF